MKTVEQYDINTLYKVLKKHDVEILKYYNNDTVSDNDYFSYGINSDIISNCLNVLTNYLSGNIESAGVDLIDLKILENTDPFACVFLATSNDNLLPPSFKPCKYLVSFITITPVFNHLYKTFSIYVLYSVISSSFFTMLYFIITQISYKTVAFYRFTFYIFILFDLA